ncbi:MAG: 4-phosphopantetheinyl transferase [Mycobacteriales bacterium]
MQPAIEPGPAPALRPGQVHVWYYDLDGPWPAGADAAGCLDGGERARADRFMRDRDRVRFRAAHCAVRHLVAGYLGCAPAELVITRDCPHCGDPKHGKPGMAAPDGTRVEVNASHSDALGGLAVALPGLELGLDVEFHRPNVDWAGILPEPLRAEPPGDGFGQWTKLEAVAKAAGTGIVKMPRLTDPHHPDWAPALLAGDGERGPSSWQVRALRAPDGYSAALAANDIPTDVQLRWHR